MHYVQGSLVLLLISCLLIENTRCIAEKEYAKQFIPRESSYFNEDHCQSDKAITKRLNGVRKLMRENHVDAYIICNENENLGKLNPYDKRLEAISGYSGKIGTAVVTLDKAALWTDGRTFQKAIDNVDCGWTVYRRGGKDATSVADWIHDDTENVISVGACPYLISSVWWNNFQRVFEEKGTTFVPLYKDLIDLVWTEDRPPLPSSPIHILPLQLAGESWQMKIKRTLHEMEDKDIDVLVLTNLDEIAWLFNLRARDFAFDPYFISFCVISATRGVISLYIMDAEKKLKDKSDFEGQRLHEFLKTSITGSCDHLKCSVNTQMYTDDNTVTCKKDSEDLKEISHTAYCVDVKEYDPITFKDDVGKLSRDQRVRKVSVSWTCSQSFVEEIPQEKLVMEYSPPLTFKAAKNRAESEGMKTSTLRESVFLTTYFAELEERIRNGEILNVQGIEAEAKELRKKELFYKGPGGISLIGFGSTALPMIPEITDDIITQNGVFLFDMGVQYLDGTTDTARSFVYGTPSERQKDIYTRLLMTQINLARKTFAVGSTGRDLDTPDIREPLHQINVDFPHEIGHMVAAYGAIIEGPASISNISATWKSDVPMDKHIFDCKDCKKPKILISTPDWRDYKLEEGMVFSNEPSFYGKGEFGMRVENTMLIIRGNCNKPCYRFEQLVFVPYESNLIKPELLTADQISWLKDYYKMVDELVTPQLEAKNISKAVKWLKDRINVDFLL
ncbi:uncharacterized protein LOC125679619 [Ostrea edulis]|uniref:uncharacterized protein LOC125679619 n=1 Tax=Ostrea edulis TaxID=37623 RepID=UPI0024AF57F0|nr:uncharacterized protein LOC125679619 [Ostrea edulis]